MICLTGEKFCDIAAETINDVAADIKTKGFMSVFAAMLTAKAEMATEDHLAQPITAGDWNITISPANPITDKVRLVMKYKNVVRIDRELSDFHTAYSYAFNILVS